MSSGYRSGSENRYADTVLFLLTLMILVPPVLAKRNDDVVVMKNGDRLTGEIKRLEDGKLIFSASYMTAEVSLDWRQVEKIESKDHFNVYLTNGGVHTGFIEKKSLEQDGSSDFSVGDGASGFLVDRENVV